MNVFLDSMVKSFNFVQTKLYLIKKNLNITL